ncbi:MAG: hypothetical protein HXY19_06390 [Thermoanaerobaculaceae bacterium]|nr:hypothetical protein [Thermoanaerobaculaceae bacterium]
MPSEVPGVPVIGMTIDDALADEERRVRQLRLVVDITAQVLAEDRHLTLCEALRLIEAARTTAARLFPGQHDTFDLVIRPRLERIVMERFGIASVAPVN